MQEIEIQKNIPIPNPTSSSGRPPKYPFRTMEIGDSFLARSKEIGGVCNTSRYKPKKFISRTTEEGLRIWRIE